MRLPADHSNPGGLPPPRPSTGFDGTPLDKSSALGLNSFVSSRGEGRIAIVTVRGAGCGGRDRCSIADARGRPPACRRRKRAEAVTTTSTRTAQVAVSRRIALRHGAAPRFAPRTEGGPRRGSPLERWFNPRVEHRGSSRSKPLKPSRAERRMCPVLSWRRHSCAFYFLHTGLRTHRASGVPRALSTEGGTFTAHLGRGNTPRECEAMSGGAMSGKRRLEIPYLETCV